MLGGVAEEELVLTRGAPLAPEVLVAEEDGEPLGPLRVAAGRVQPRERRMRQDVDELSSARTRSARPPRPRPSRMVDASAHVGRCACEGRKGGGGVHRRDSPIEPQVLRFRREPSVGERRLERPVLPQDVGRLLRADPARARELVRRVAAQRDEVGHLLGLDAVALAHLRRADPRELAHALDRLQDRDAVAGELERVTVGGRDEHVAVPRRARRRRGSRRPRSPAPSPSRSRTPRRPAAGSRAARRSSPRTRARLVRPNASCRYVGTVSVSQATSTQSGFSACQSRVTMFVKPTTALEADRLRQPVVGAVRERVAVDREERAHARDASSSRIRAIIRSVASCDAARRSSLPRRSSMSTGAPYATRSGPKRSSRFGPRDRGRHERDAGLERDPRGAGPRPRRVLLDESLRTACSLGEHHHGVPLAREPHGRLDRLGVGLAAPHLERAGAVDDVAQRPPVELRLRHDPQPVPRPERHPERPRVEARDVIARENEAARGGEVLLAAKPKAVRSVQHGRTDDRDKAVDRRRLSFERQYLFHGLS